MAANEERQRVLVIPISFDFHVNIAYLYANALSTAKSGSCAINRRVRMLFTASHDVVQSSARLSARMLYEKATDGVGDVVLASASIFYGKRRDARDT
jgi:hypothetical protein